MRTDAPVVIARRTAAWAEAILESGGAPRDGRRFAVRLFADLEDYRRYASTCGVDGAEAFYDSSRREIVLPLAGRRPWEDPVRAHDIDSLDGTFPFG